MNRIGNRILQGVACLALVLGVVVAQPAEAQWDPTNGLWGKDDPADLRVMTWNVQDRLCRSNDKTEGFNSWTALARIVAAMKPDVLILQETADNSGNGTGSGVDSVSQAMTVFDLFLHGGSDPFQGGTVTAYVQKYDPAFDMPFVFVSSDTDGWNRNVILSRYPFADLNGSGTSTMSNFASISDAYAPGGDGGIRGFGMAEIDLPDNIYGGDMVIGNSHLKAGGGSSNFSRRLIASQNIAYFIDYLLNGAGTGNPDPNNKIFDSPAATSILSPETVVVAGGDWNEDETSNGRRGPAEWITRAQNNGGTDGTDRDRSDMIYDDARDPFTNNSDTQSSSKLDYLAWQDSIATLRRAFIFNAGSIGNNTYPPEIADFLPFPQLASSFSDHRPVLVDLILPSVGNPTPPGNFSLISPADGATDQDFEPVLSWAIAQSADTYDVTIATDAQLTAVIHQATGLSGNNFQVPAGVMSGCQTYFWGVEAFNTVGSTQSTPASYSLTVFNPADLTQDGAMDVLDFFFFVTLFNANDPLVDLNNDGGIDVLDFFTFITLFSSC